MVIISDPDLRRFAVDKLSELFEMKTGIKSNGPPILQLMEPTTNDASFFIQCPPHQM